MTIHLPLSCCLSFIHSIWVVLLVSLHCHAFSTIPLPWQWQSSGALPRFATFDSIPSASSGTEEIEFLPSRIVLDRVSLQYPDTFVRRLFSSVPRRTFAVNHVSCRFQSEIVLVQGASSSGKSALMKLLLVRDEGPGMATIGGSIVLDCCRRTAPQAVAPMAARPILLADRPALDDRRSVRTILEEEARRALTPPTKAAAGRIMETLAQMARLDGTVLGKQTPADLSPSENYRFRLVQACIQSSCAAIATSNDMQPPLRLLLPAPILLLDEWMDLETRETSSKVEDALLEIVTNTGAVVLCATHKPNLWKKLTVTSPVTSQMTMCRGEILTLQQLHDNNNHETSPGPQQVG